jgi:predicted permease
MLSLINFVLLGYILKSYFHWDAEKTTTFRRATFNLLLPVFILRNTWVAVIDDSLLSVVCYSSLIHTGLAVFWWFVYRGIPDRTLRGWLQMVSQGCLTSFFYANLSNHPAFGQRAVAVCLLWDIGGNTPVAQGYLWGLAAFYAPSRPASPTSSSYRTAYSMKRLDIESSVEDESTSLLRRGDGRPGESAGRSWLDIIKAVLYQPILPAFFIGLILNSRNVPCPEPLDYTLEGLGLLFKPCLYFLIGLYAELITNINQLKTVLLSLGLRYISIGVVAVLMYLSLPAQPIVSVTMALSLLSPVTTMSMYLTAEYGYPSHLLGMSATLTTISVFLSFLIQEFVMRFF